MKQVLEMTRRPPAQWARTGTPRHLEQTNSSGQKKKKACFALLGPRRLLHKDGQPEREGKKHQTGGENPL